MNRMNRTQSQLLHRRDSTHISLIPAPAGAPPPARDHVESSAGDDGSMDMDIEWCYSVRERVFLLVNPRLSVEWKPEREQRGGHRKSQVPPTRLIARCGPTAACTSSRHNLRALSASSATPRRHIETPTNTALLVTVALAARPRALALRTVCVRVVLVPDLVEEVDLLLALEQCGGDTVHRCVAPALSTARQRTSKWRHS